MTSPNKLPALARLTVMLLVPTMACFGYYTLDGLDPARSAWAIPAVLSYPAALVGLLGLVSTLRAGQPTRVRVLLWSLCLTLPVALLLWLHG
jgi:hypothetical protein